MGIRNPLSQYVIELYQTNPILAIGLFVLSLGAFLCLAVWENGQNKS